MALPAEPAGWWRPRQWRPGCVPYGLAAVRRNSPGLPVRWGHETRTVALGDLEISYQTPSSANGADFVRQFEGVEWDLLES
jgi:hypothetical protein